MTDVAVELGQELVHFEHVVRATPPTTRAAACRPVAGAAERSTGRRSTLRRRRARRHYRDRLAAAALAVEIRKVQAVALGEEAHLAASIRLRAGRAGERLELLLKPVGIHLW
jgi:hypothetical protein